MKIKEFLQQKDFDYKQALVIYSGTKHPNQNLLRLFSQKKSLGNINKLKYELKKRQEEDFVSDLRGEETKPTSLGKGAANAQVITSKPPNFESSQDSAAKQFRFLQINDLPIELHPLFIQQKGEFANACSLKMQMNALLPEQQTKALEFCLEIERLFDSIEKIWKVFDHYTDHGEVLQLQVNKYQSSSPAQLIKAEANKRASITKTKKRVAQYETALPTLTTLQQQTKCKRALVKSSKGLLQHELDLEQIKQLMAKK